MTCDRVRLPVSRGATLSHRPVRAEQAARRASGGNLGKIFPPLAQRGNRCHHHAVSDNKRLSGIHVLVVDDNSDAREIFQSVITYMGALVTVAVSAEIALKITRHVRPAVMAVDLAMPRRDGAGLIWRPRPTKPGRGGELPPARLPGHAPTRARGPRHPRRRQAGGAAHDRDRERA